MSRLWFLVMVVAIAGCDRAEVSPSADKASQATQPADSNLPKFEEEEPHSEELAGAITCPDPAQTSNLNIVGIELGMSADDAMNRIQCSSPGLIPEFKQYPRNRPGGNYRDYIVASNESSNERHEFRVELAGIPGEERVTAASRTVRFAEGSKPLVANIVAELNRKYGLRMEQETINKRWSGMRYEKTGRERQGNFYLCFPTRHGGSGSMAEPHDYCGLAVRAFIQPQTNNSALVDQVTVFVGDGQVFAREIARYADYVQREQQNRQVREIEGAKGRPVPTL